MSRELPKLGGRFVQMEDEIASIAAVIGASVGGLKAQQPTPLTETLELVVVQHLGGGTLAQHLLES